jgi:aromatic-amino-acid transaminase
MIHVIPSHQGRPSDDPIFALNKEATERKKKGEAIVNATVGALLDDDGKLAILPTTSRIVREVPADEWAAYAPIAGSKDFLDAVIADLFRDEPEMRACAVAAATPGGSGALRQAIANYLEPGQSLLTTSFFWGPYQTLCDEADRKLTTFTMFVGEGLPGPLSGLDVGALDKALEKQLAEQKRALVFLNDPCHNPTGYSMRASEWRAVVERLIAHGEKAPVTLLVDTAYFAYAAGDPRAFLKELRPLVGKVGLNFAWSASKTFTHYGLRVGAIVACVPDENERKQTDAAFSYSCRGTWSNCTRGGMRAVTRLLAEPELARACDAERSELRALLDTRVAKWNELAPKKGLRYPRYEGGFFVTVFTDDAHERALRMKEKGVFVVPQKGALRVALCSVAAKDVAKLVDAF